MRCVSVRSRCPVGRGRHPDTLRPKDLVEAGHEFAVAIVDQERRPQVRLTQLPAQITCLLDDPGRGRPLGAAGQEHPARSQLDKEQRVWLLQPDGIDGEEVAGQAAAGMGPQESLPAESRPPRRRRHAVTAQVEGTGRSAGPLESIRLAAVHLSDQIGQQVGRVGRAQSCDRVPADGR